MEFKPLSDYAKRKIFPDHWETLNACLGLQIGICDADRVAVRINYNRPRFMSISDAKDFIEGFYFYHAQRSKFSP